MQIELHKMRADEQRERVHEIDNKMLQEFKNRSCGEVTEILKEWWTTQCIYNEDISNKRWKKNDRWLQHYKKRLSSHL